ncbi:hypothetical protein Tco_0833793 [Tanacetum coccineum]
MQIPDWMITEEMKHTEHYRMYAEVWVEEEQEARGKLELVNKHLRLKRLKSMRKDQRMLIDDSLPPRFLSRKSFDTLAVHLQEKTKDQRRDRTDDLQKAYLQERGGDGGNIQAEISLQIHNAIDNHIPSQVDALVRSYMSGHILHVHPVQSQTAYVPEQQYQLPQAQQTTCKTSAVRPRDQDDPHDDAHPEGKNSAKRHKTSEYESYMFGESSSGQVNEEERGPSTSRNQEQVDDNDFWTDSYASDDDEIPMKQVSQDIMEEVSLTINEAKSKKMADEMLTQRCTSGDEHQYHIDQMKNFLKSDIVWESKKEILVSPHPRKTTPLVQSCQRDPEAPALSLINQDLLYLKKGSSGPEKINPHAKIFYIKKQKEPGKPKEEVYSNSKIIQVIKTYWELGHEYKFITEIVARRADECIVSITEPDYKNLNKNDIEDMYLLIMNDKVPDYAKTGLLRTLSVFIRSSVIWETVHDFQLGIKSLKSYNNDVKYGYVKRELTNDEVEYLKLFEEEIEVRLKYCYQMRRWEMYVNGRPLGLRREHPE